MEPEARTAALWAGITGLVLCVLGLADAIYLTVEHYAKVPLACPDTGFINCQKVTHSSYATQFGIPLPVFGLVFFLVAAALCSPRAWRSTSRLIREGRLLLCSVGVVSVLWLIWVEFVRLKNLCLYCTGVHALTILLFVVTAVGTVATAPTVDNLDDEDFDELPADTRDPTPTAV